MRRLLCAVVLFAWCGQGYAANETSPDPVDLLRRRLATSMPASYMTTGCLPAVPGALTFAAFACEGTIVSLSKAVPVSQSAAALGPLTGGNGTYWLALHIDNTTTVGGWTRQRGTHYLWSKADAKPALTTGTALAKVTVAGGSITAVDDLRVPASYVRNGTYEVTDPLYGGIANDSTDVGPALRAAIAAAIAQHGRIVRIPQGVYALGSAIDIPEGVEVRGDGWAPTTPLITTNTEPRRGTWLHITSTAVCAVYHLGEWHQAE